jgi:hypothetical protein
MVFVAAAMLMMSRSRTSSPNIRTPDISDELELEAIKVRSDL